MRRYLHSGLFGPGNRTLGWKWGTLWAVLALAWLAMLDVFVVYDGGFGTVICAAFCLVLALRAYDAFTGE